MPPDDDDLVTFLTADSTEPAAVFAEIVASLIASGLIVRNPNNDGFMLSPLGQGILDKDTAILQ